MKILILDEATQDLIDGFRFYEIQNQGLGNYFLDSVFFDIESLRTQGGIHPIHLGFHRLLAKRFPFAVYYRIEHSVVQVWAILDCRRNPDKTKNRLKKT